MAALSESDIGALLRDKFAALLDSASNLKAGVAEHLLPVLGDKDTVGLQLTSTATATNEAGNLARRELAAKLLSTCLGLAVSLTISYFGIKWLSNAMDPTRQEKKDAQKKAEKLMRRIGVASQKLSEYELCIASNLIDPQSMVVSWDDIGGLDNIIEEIQESVILPFKRRELFCDSGLLQPPKGVLVYGPPGCGKTMLAKAMAKAAGARFINLQVSSLVDKWYGESQKRAEAVFSLAIKLQPTIVFIDEIDSFLRSRTSNDHEATAMIKTQFMSFWDGLMTDQQCNVMIVGATNRPQDVDPAILRRMPCMFHVGLPNTSQRANILDLILEDEPVSSDVDTSVMAGLTEGFSGSDLRELCRNAAIFRVRDYLRREREEEFQDAQASPQAVVLRPMQHSDFQASLYKMRQSKLVSTMPLQQVDLD